MQPATTLSSFLQDHIEIPRAGLDPSVLSTESPSDWGIVDGFHQIDGQWRATDEETAQQILRSMAATETWRIQRELLAPYVVEWGTTKDVARDWIVLTEQGDRVEGAGELSKDLPTGYHRLFVEGERTRTLIIRPNACPSFDDVWAWGWALQLYAARSNRSWGIGDFGDLARFGAIARQHGASIALLNPLHAPLPGIPQESSPYYPSSREFRNPLYIAVEDVPGAREIVEDLDELAQAGRALNDSSRIDRDAVWQAKLGALERIWELTDPSPAFLVYVEQSGLALQRYATFCAIGEVHGRIWHEWPDALKDPASDAVEQFAHDHAERVKFHAWLQWLLNDQLNAAAKEISLIQDLAIGVDPAGADAWLWQDVLALDMRVGAPPDYCNLDGQDWGAPPLDPWRLRALDYEPFIRTIRANLRRNGGIRIDHVMGMFRLFWIPQGESAQRGAYVTYPWEDMLGIVALEAQRAGALVIGEDLGTVEPFMREELASHNIASYKLAWFEPDSPNTFPQAAFTAATTHDLPTIAGVWTGTDIEVQHAIGLRVDTSMNSGIRSSMMEKTGVEADATAEEFADGVHKMISGAASAMVAATMEDALGVEPRPNYPGTTTQYPNWSIALPVRIDDLEHHDGFLRTARTMDEGRRQAKISKAHQ